MPSARTRLRISRDGLSGRPRNRLRCAAKPIPLSRRASRTHGPFASTDALLTHPAFAAISTARCTAGCKPTSSTLTITRTVRSVLGPALFRSQLLAIPASRAEVWQIVFLRSRRNRLRAVSPFVGVPTDSYAAGSGEVMTMKPMTRTGFRLDDGQIEVVDPLVAKCLRERSIAERLEMVFDANRTMRGLIEARLRTDHSDWTDPQIQAEIARRMLHGAA